MPDKPYLPGLEGVPATHSKISFIDGQTGVLEYQGYAIESLAAHSHFEETAMLLLGGDLPTAAALTNFDQSLRHARPVVANVFDLMRLMPTRSHPMDLLQTAVVSLGMFDPICDVPPDGLAQRLHMAMHIIARLPTLVAGWDRIRNGLDPVAPDPALGHAENFLYMLNGVRPDPLHAKILDTCLVLHAEHTINASTFAVLVTGSTLANPYAVIAGAIATLSGPLHGGANEKVVAMLKEIDDAADVEQILDEKLQRKEKIWGFGHREYKTKDPRARILQGLMEQLAEQRGLKHSRLFDTARALEAAAEKRLAGKGVYPNVDFYSGVLYDEMGISTDLFTPIFAMARSAGWLAHWHEQLANNRIFRPTQVYTGKRGCTYLPIAKRDALKPPDDSAQRAAKCSPTPLD